MGVMNFTMEFCMVCPLRNQVNILGILIYAYNVDNVDIVVSVVMILLIV